jgi:Protein of unknown function (DUF1593)
VQNPIASRGHVAKARRGPRRRAPWLAACGLAALGLGTTAGPAAAEARPRHDERPRTVVTTDMEQDDLASLIRYLLYTNDVDTQGLVYTSGRFHWAGDGKGTPFFLPDREYDTPQTSWRWTGTRTIQDGVLKAYAEVYPNLRRHDPDYPTPRELRAKVKVGNVEFENSMDRDSAGSNLIKRLLLDRDPRTLYLQAWGGTNTIARALESIEIQYSGSRHWPRIKRQVSRKAVILASGFQDETYERYIAPHWPQLRVENLEAGYATWGYNCDFGGVGNVRGLPADRRYFQGAWIKAHIEVGPYGSLYRSWLDGQAMPGDQLDIFGDPVKAQDGWCPPLAPYDFLSEGDNVAFNRLLDTGIDVPGEPALGGWGGRLRRESTRPDLWTLVAKERDQSGEEVEDYTTLRWAGAAQNDFAARMQWTLTPRGATGNHPPRVRIVSPETTRVRAGQTLRLRAAGTDPDRDALAFRWFHYREEGSFPGLVSLGSPDRRVTRVTIPRDARPGQTISLIVGATDDGTFPLTRYARVILRVV